MLQSRTETGDKGWNFEVTFPALCWCGTFTPMSCLVLFTTTRFRHCVSGQLPRWGPSIWLGKTHRRSASWVRESRRPRRSKGCLPCGRAYVALRSTHRLQKVEPVSPPECPRSCRLRSLPWRPASRQSEILTLRWRLPIVPKISFSGSGCRLERTW
ncbi:hypothetical protein D9M70_583460 [compost metagenome]